MVSIASCSPSPCDCCVGTAYIKPGEQAQVTIDFSLWLSANSGFSLVPLIAPTLTFRKFSTGGFISVPAGELVTVPDYGTSPALATQFKGNELRMILLVDEDVPLNSAYRIDILVSARDCDARIITKKECVLITASDC